MKRVIILTGDELRHLYFRISLSNDNRFEVVKSFCEGTEKSLEFRIFGNANASELEKRHVLARKQSEVDFFGEVSSQLIDRSDPLKIRKGEINDEQIVRQIRAWNPDLLICYGSSLIKSELLEVFKNRFLNVHLGLSPYYRGSGTNVWPLINKEPHMVGATFMYIDAGIDSGEIIHQIRADMFLGDSPHSIGNRLIRKMTKAYADIIAHFDSLTHGRQPESTGKLYKMGDFDAVACERLYRNFSEGMIEAHLDAGDSIKYPYIVENRALKGSL